MYEAPELDNTAPSSARASGWLTTIVVVWLLTAFAGTAALIEYASRPGSRAPVVAIWPASCEVLRAADRPTLVMFIHPHCPCTYASVSELARVMSSARGRLDAVALVLRPSPEPAGWTDTRTTRLAAAIPGVRVQLDADGAQARLFGATTSGHVAVYDADGRLAFSGGITRARGHEGDNAGSAAIVAFAAGARQELVTSDVFGCELFGPDAACAACAGAPR